MRRVLVVLAAGVLTISGCASGAVRYPAATATALQEQVLAVTAAASDGEVTTALTRLDELTASTKDARVRGTVTEARHDSIMSAIELVRADLESLAAEADESEQKPAAEKPVGDQPAADTGGSENGGSGGGSGDRGSDGDDDTGSEDTGGDTGGADGDGESGSADDGEDDAAADDAEEPGAKSTPAPMSTPAPTAAPERTGTPAVPPIGEIDLDVEEEER